MGLTVEPNSTKDNKKSRTAFINSWNFRLINDEVKVFFLFSFSFVCGESTKVKLRVSQKFKLNLNALYVPSVLVIELQLNTEYHSKFPIYTSIILCQLYLYANSCI